MSESNEIASGTSVQIPAKWEIDQRSVPVLANEAYITSAAGLSSSGLQLTLGHVNPPFFDGAPTQTEIDELGALPIVVVGRFHLPIEVARSICENLKKMIEELETRVESEDD